MKYNGIEDVVLKLSEIRTQKKQLLYSKRGGDLRSCKRPSLGSFTSGNARIGTKDFSKLRTRPAYFVFPPPDPAEDVNETLNHGRSQEALLYMKIMINA